MTIKEYLDRHSVRYEMIGHVPTFTAQQMAAEMHIKGLNIAKPVVVRADNEIYMCVLPACSKIDIDHLKEQVNASEVELLSEKELAKLFPECQLGAEPPFGSLYGLTTIMDASLEDDYDITFQAGNNDKAIKMTMQDYKKLVHPCVMDFSYHMS